MQFSALIINGRKQALWKLSGSRSFFSTPFWLPRTMWANGISPTAHFVVTGLHVQLLWRFLCSALLLQCILYAHLIRLGNTYLYNFFTYRCVWFVHTGCTKLLLCVNKATKMLIVKCKRCKNYELIFTGQDMWRFWGSNKLPPDTFRWLQCIYLL